MRGKINKERILEASLEILENKSPSELTLKELAEKLNIKSPSLYKHFENIDTLHDWLAEYSLTLLYDVIETSIKGDTTREKIETLMISCRQFVLQNLNLYEYIQNTSYWKSKSTYSISDKITSQLSSVIELENKDETVHFIRYLRSYLTGFIDLEIKSGFGMSVDLEESFLYGISKILDQVE